MNVIARLKSRRIGKPGLVKISMSNLEERKLVLREKRKLKQTEQYNLGFLRGSKSYADRILELNALLNDLPNGNQFWIKSNGRTVKISLRQQTRASNEHTEPGFERDETY